MTVEATLTTDSDDTNPYIETDKPVASEAAEKIDWWGEIKGIFWLLLAVLGFHSFIAKPFYIPSESMVPNLLVGDRLVVNKMSYGWSFVSPTIPNPVAIFKWLAMGQSPEGLAFQLPEWKGRVWGSIPEQGDVVILTPPGKNSDYIKRVIGLPGDTLEVRAGVVILNGKPVQRAAMTEKLVPVDANSPCADIDVSRVSQPDGSIYCRLPIYRETLPNGKSYDTVDVGPGRAGDDYGPIKIPENHVFLMGDNRDHSADSRFSLASNGLGGPVPYENIGGRAMMITFSMDGSAQWYNPISWFSALRGGRAGTSLSPDEAPAK